MRFRKHRTAGHDRGRTASRHRGDRDRRQERLPAAAFRGPFTVDGANNVSEVGNLTNSNGAWANAESDLVQNDLGNVAGGHFFVLSNICRGACVTGFAGDESPVPEPGTIAMLGLGLLATGVLVRRSKSRA